MALLEMRVVLAVLVLGFEFGGVPERLAGFEALEVAVRRPRVCFVRPTPRGKASVGDA